MAKIKLTVTEANCRCGYHKTGDVFIVDDLCPPLCHELWNCAYPFVYALQNGALLEQGTNRTAAFEVKCPDKGRVTLCGERLET